MTEEAYFQRGFGLKSEIKGSLVRDYHSGIVEALRGRGFRLKTPRVEVRLAEEFGFCYGVDRAVEYAYETVEMFPNRKITLIGEIIHNPHVNNILRDKGVTIITPEEAVEAAPRFGPEDVVIIPAFGVPVPLFQALKATGCVLVDTTCGSVLNVWKNVDRYGKAGITSVIHGKYGHEETRATASQATRHEGGQYLIVRNMEEAQVVCEYIRRGGDKEAFLARFAPAVSPGFDPDRHLFRIGVANQTTMLSSESLAIAEELRRAIADRHGEGDPERFRAFDTICSATQDRQDAVIKLAKEKLDLMLVIGGYNSSNTNHLAAIAAKTSPTYHIQNAECILDETRIRHKPAGGHEEIVSEGWFPGTGAVVGFTAGASTPNVKVGEAIERVLACYGTSPAECGLIPSPTPSMSS